MKTPLGCGITGSVNCVTSAETLESMTNSLKHRGPDSYGFWSNPERSVLLGHRRLAIIGVDESGSQPMRRGSLIISFNGEVYNYPALKNELEGKGFRFSSNCDTEVLLFAYEAWGIDFLKRLNGIFAFAIFNEKDQTILLARDSMGVKPLVYAFLGDRGMLFASEPKAILQHPDFKKRPNYNAIKQDMIHKLWAPKKETWFEGILTLNPGSYLLMDVATGKRKQGVFWAPPQEGATLFDESSILERFRYLLTDSVKLQLLSDVGISTTNSGGLDSSAVTAIAAQTVRGNLQAFTVEYDGHKPFSYDSPLPEDASPGLCDRWHAEKLVQAFPNISLSNVSLPETTFFTREKIDRLVKTFDGLPTDVRTLSISELFGQIRKTGHKVVLTGQGADEIWMGYYHSPIQEFWRYQPEQLSAAYLACEHFSKRVLFGMEAFNSQFLNSKVSFDLSYAHLSENYVGYQTDDPLNNLTHFAYKTHLQTLLNMDDKLSMMHSLEARVPWLDHRLTELSFRIPGYLKINSPDSNRAKWLSRKALRGIVPDFILDRKKQPFPPPPDKYKESLRKIVEEDLPTIKKALFMRHIFSDRFLENLANKNHLSGPELFFAYCMWRFSVIYEM